jgi:hypothetical protein
MSEISEYEKQLNPGLSFEKHIESLTFQLAERVDERDARKFFDYWEAWVLDLPQNVLDLDLLAEVQLKYFLGANARSADLPDYSYFLRSCAIYAAAAQRAHNRADSCAAWDLFITALAYLNKVKSIETELFILEQKTAKSARAVSNGDVPGQRVRYQIIALLHRDRENQKAPVLFKSVKLAIEKIDDDIARFIEANELQISHVKLVSKVKSWIRDHPAFRAEIAPFFTDGVIEG